MLNSSHLPFFVIYRYNNQINSRWTLQEYQELRVKPQENFTGNDSHTLPFTIILHKSLKRYRKNSTDGTSL